MHKLTSRPRADRKFSTGHDGSLLMSATATGAARPLLMSAQNARSPVVSPIEPSPVPSKNKTFACLLDWPPSRNRLAPDRRSGCLVRSCFQQTLLVSPTGAAPLSFSNLLSGTGRNSLGQLIRPFHIPLIALALATGCLDVYRNLPEWTTFDETSTEAIVVLAVSPKARLTLASGITDRSGWHESGAFPTVKSAWSEDGYVVVKVSPRTGQESYAVVRMTPEGFGGDTYAASQNADVAVFHAIPGQITYVGAIRLEVHPQKNMSDHPGFLTVDENSAPDDADRVARFMAKNYPKVHASVRTEALRLIRKTDF